MLAFLPPPAPVSHPTLSRTAAVHAPRRHGPVAAPQVANHYLGAWYFQTPNGYYLGLLYRAPGDLGCWTLAEAMRWHHASGDPRRATRQMPPPTVFPATDDASARRVAERVARSRGDNFQAMTEDVWEIGGNGDVLAAMLAHQPPAWVDVRRPTVALDLADLVAVAAAPAASCSEHA